MAIKEPDYVILVMTKYGTSEHLMGWTHSGGTRERVGSWRPNNSTIVRS